MIARITRTLLLIQFAVAATFFFLALKIWHVQSVWLALLLSVGIVYLFRLLITANNFFLAWLYRSTTPDEYRLDWWGALRLFRGEFNATMLSSSWSMPFLAFKQRIAGNPSGLPVLFIHGYGCNSGYWHAMSKLLANANISHGAVDLEPVFGGIDDFVPIVDRAVEALCKTTRQDKIIIVAHSMGGLVSRAYLRARGGTRIAKVITLGTPHHGTGLANSGIGLNGRQMRWTGRGENGRPSDWLQELEKTEDRTLRPLFVSIYSHHDNIISPQTSSHLPGAKNLEFHGIGHVALALHPLIQARVLDEIQRTSDALACPQALESA